MSANTWLGGAGATKELYTVTPASVTVGNIFTLTIGNSTVTFTATAATVPNVTAGLVAAAQAATAPPEFAEFTWADISTAITATGVTAGRQISLSSSAAQGSGSAGMTLVTVHTTTATGPNYWSNAQNWSLGAVPVNGDDVYITGTADNILYGLDQSAVTLTSLTIDTKTILIGLPLINADGTSYGEYRQSYLKVGATTLNIIHASGRVKIDNSNIQTAFTLHAAETSEDTDLGYPAVLWKGTQASNTVTALGGTLGVAFFGGETATVATLRTAGANVICGTGVTHTTVTTLGGDLTTQAAITTYNIFPGAGTVTHLAGAVTTLNCYAGQLSYQSSGTITTLNVGGEGKVNFEDNPIARTVTNANYYSGAKIEDRGKSVTHTNPVTLAGCSLKNVDLDYGFGRTLAIAG